MNEVEKRGAMLGCPKWVESRH